MAEDMSGEDAAPAVRQAEVVAVDVQPPQGPQWQQGPQGPQVQRLEGMLPRVKRLESIPEATGACGRGCAPTGACMRAGCGGEAPEKSRCWDGTTFREFAVRNLSFLSLHYMYFISLALIGGGVICAFERGGTSYADALFMSSSAATVTGLATVDVSTMRLGSQLTLFFLLILGGSAFMSSVPVMIRLHYWRKHVERTVPDAIEQQRVFREEKEYRALLWVVRLSLTMTLGWPILFGVIWGFYFQFAPVNFMLQEQGIRPWWFSFFLAFASYNNAGFSLFSDSLVSFAGDYVVLLMGAWLILIGNVAYPILFRVAVWLAYVAGGKRDDSLQYLLERPRRCYTHMFPATATRLLMLAVSVSTLVQWFMFLILDYNVDVVRAYPGPIRALIGWFQSVSTRTAGFNVLDISQVSAAMQVIYLFMMYVSVYPTALAVRETGKKEASRERDEADERMREDDARLEAALADLQPATPEQADEPAPATPKGHHGRHMSSFVVAEMPSPGRKLVTGASKYTYVNLTAEELAEAARRIATENVGKDAADIAEVQDESKHSADRRSDQPNQSLHAGVLHEEVFPTQHAGVGSSAQGVKQRRHSQASASAIRQMDSYNAHELGVELGGVAQENDGDLVAAAESVSGSMTSILSRDLVWLSLALLIICIAEQWPLHSTPHPRHFNVFSILFELVSAYGTVGLSFGYADSSVSLSGQFRVISKLVIILAMITGRHRGLPFSIDAAVYLPTLLKGRAAAPPEHPASSRGPEGSFAAWSVAMLERGAQSRNMRSLRSLFPAARRLSVPATGPASSPAGALEPTSPPVSAGGTRKPLQPDTRVGPLQLSPQSSPGARTPRRAATMPYTPSRRGSTQHTASPPPSTRDREFVAWSRSRATSFDGTDAAPHAFPLEAPPSSPETAASPADVASVQQSTVDSDASSAV